MSTRLFSILRRKPGFLDFSTPLLDAIKTGVYKYSLRTDTDPGGAFGTTVVTVTGSGLLDAAVAGPQNPIIPGNNVRVVIKPSNHGLSDTAYFWLKLVYVDSVGADMTDPAPSAATLILPPTASWPALFGFNATAPSGAALTDSLRIDLPSVENFQLTNTSSRDVYLSVQEGSPEMLVPAGKVAQGFFGRVSSFWIRGSGGTATFSVEFAQPNFR